MGPYLETTESAAPPLLVLSPASSLVRITLCGVNSTCDGLTAFSRERPGEPVAGNPLGGLCARGRGQASLSQQSLLPTLICRTHRCQTQWHRRVHRTHGQLSS